MCTSSRTSGTQSRTSSSPGTPSSSWPLLWRGSWLSSGIFLPKLCEFLNFKFCRPIQYRSLELNSNLSYFPRVLAYLLPSLFFSILLNIPKFLELRLITEFTDMYNVTHQLEEVGVDVTLLRTDPYYVTYYSHWTRENTS